MRGFGQPFTSLWNQYHFRTTTELCDNLFFIDFEKSEMSSSKHTGIDINRANVTDDIEQIMSSVFFKQGWMEIPA